jgi:hypothetical protein
MKEMKQNDPTVHASGDPCPHPVSHLVQGRAQSRLSCQSWDLVARLQGWILVQFSLSHTFPRPLAYNPTHPSLSPGSLASRSAGLSPSELVFAD